MALHDVLPKQVLCDFHTVVAVHISGGIYAMHSNAHQSSLSPPAHKSQTPALIWEFRDPERCRKIINHELPEDLRCQTGPPNLNGLRVPAKKLSGHSCVLKVGLEKLRRPAFGSLIYNLIAYMLQ